MKKLRHCHPMYTQLHTRTQFFLNQPPCVALLQLGSGMIGAVLYRPDVTNVAEPEV